MSLFSSIQTAASSLQAYSLALSADQQNVANSASPGYAALRAVILPLGNSGQGGADRVVITSAGDSRADSLVRDTLSQSGASQATAAQLAQVNGLFDITGNAGILAAFQRFSAAFANAAVNPNDTTLRSIALSAAGSVADSFNSVANSLGSQQGQVDSAIQATVGQINDLGAQISAYNAQTLRGTEPNPAADAGLRSALDSLSSLVDIGVSKNLDGTVSVLIGGRQPLVVGTQAFRISADGSAAPGAQVTSSGGGTSPSTLLGKLGALLQFRSQTLPALTGGNGSPGQLNILAKGFASRVNALLGSGGTAAGAPGVPIFTYDPSNDADVAQTLKVDPTVTPDQLALGTSGPTGQSNSIANVLAQLPGSNQSADQIAGLSPQSYFSSIASRTGQEYADAQQRNTTDQSSVTSSQANRTQVSSVSLDQEAVNITSYQRAYEAAAKIVSVLDQLTNDEVNLIK